MRSVIVCVVPFVLLFTKVHCLTSLDEIDVQYQPLVNKTAFKILDALTEESTKIGRALDRIEDSTSDSEESIQEELSELEEFVQDSLDDAKDADVSIESCVNRILDFINATTIDDAFKRCKRPPQLKRLRLQKRSIGKISAALPEEVNLCIYQAENLGSNLEQCLQYRTFQLEKRIAQIAAAVERLIDRATESSFKCTNSVMERLDLAINRNARKFAECTKTILDLEF